MTGRQSGANTAGSCSVNVYLGTCRLGVLAAGGATADAPLPPGSCNVTSSSSLVRSSSISSTDEARDCTDGNVAESDNHPELLDGELACFGAISLTLFVLLDSFECATFC